MLRELKKLTEMLQWDVNVYIDKSMSPYSAEVVSIQQQHQHSITLGNVLLTKDSIKDRSRILALIAHELCHAVLAERVHPLLSTLFFYHTVHRRDIELVSPCLLSAADFYADELLFSTYPNLLETHLATGIDTLKLIEFGSADKIEELMKQIESDALIMAGLGLALYQTRRYNIRTATRFPNKAYDIAEVFEHYDPTKPAVESFMSLANSLLDRFKILRRVKTIRLYPEKVDVIIIQNTVD